MLESLLMPFIVMALVGIVFCVPTWGAIWLMAIATSDWSGAWDCGVKITKASALLCFIGAVIILLA